MTGAEGIAIWSEFVTYCTPAAMARECIRTGTPFSEFALVVAGEMGHAQISRARLIKGLTVAMLAETDRLGLRAERTA